MFMGAIFIVMYLLSAPYVAFTDDIAGPYLALWVSSGMGGWLIFHCGVRQMLQRRKDK